MQGGGRKKRRDKRQEARGKRQEARGKRQEARDKQPLSQASMVCCRSDKDRRDASDGATLNRMQDAGCMRRAHGLFVRLGLRWNLEPDGVGTVFL